MCVINYIRFASCQTSSGSWVSPMALSMVTGCRSICDLEGFGVYQKLLSEMSRDHTQQNYRGSNALPQVTFRISHISKTENVAKHTRGVQAHLHFRVSSSASVKQFLGKDCVCAIALCTDGLPGDPPAGRSACRFREVSSLSRSLSLSLLRALALSCSQSPPRTARLRET